ncbi:MAG: ribonuclease HI family protein [Candidatus Bathyarchaeia archaeon]
MDELKVYVDGSGRTGAYCYLVAGGKPRLFMERGLTNNQAEYKAIIATLEEIPERELTVYSDSQLAVKQLNGEYQIRDSKLKSLAERVWRLSRGRVVSFKWIPREQNQAGKVLEKLSRPPSTQSEAISSPA